MRVAAVFLALTFLLLAGVSPSLAVITAETGFINENAQLLVLGELVDVEDLEDPEFSTSDIEAFFYVVVRGDTQDELNKNIRMHIEFSSLGEVIYESWTAEPFTLEQWQTSPIGNNGRYTNDQLDELEATPWFNEDVVRSTDFNAETLTQYMDGPNLAGGIYLIKLEVFEVLPNGTEVPLAYAIAPIQVTSPSRPRPITPLDGDEVQGYPVFLSWTGVGAQVLPSDITLVIVEADPTNFDDPQTVIDNRSVVDTRYEGMPQFSDYHVYTGVAGSEQQLTDGMTYVWTVKVDVFSAGGQTYTYESPPSTFVFNEAAGADMGELPQGGDADQGGGLGAEGGVLNNPPLERDTNEPIPDPVFSVLLQGGLSQEQVQELIKAFEGYYVQDIRFDGNFGQTYSTLARKLNQPGLEVITVIYEGEE